MAVPDVGEGADDNLVIIRAIELQEAVEEVLELIFGVNLLLQNHLQHRLPEIQIRIVRLLLHCHARRQQRRWLARANPAS